MGLFTKKEEKKDNLLPELPKLPELPSLPEKQSSEKTDLPALPKSSGMETIKSSITQPQEKRSFEISDISNKPKQMEKGPIYIKLDKFKEAAKNFETIKNKLVEIEDSFRKLKDIKEKEDAELKDWETELQTIKSRINVIDSSLFNKLEE